MIMPMNIYEWMEDFDNAELDDYERKEALRDSVVAYNLRYADNPLASTHNPDSTVSRYLRMKRQNIFRDND